METWAHGQAVYDELGQVRTSTDAIENIVVLGWNTYAWTFRNRNLAVPEPKPSLNLKAPSGKIWLYEGSGRDELIEGSAEDFCQIVTQTRNIDDTSLQVVGENATAWMSVAQCFAGPPVDPPAAGTRRIRLA
jgi:uncharacterized protein (TIGR03084 family)